MGGTTVPPLIDPKDLVIPSASQGLEKSYQLSQQIGEGCFGVVRLCQDIETQEEYACKTIKKTNVPDLELLRREVNNLKAVQPHPYIIQLKDVFEDEENVHLVTEYCNGRDIADYGAFSESVAAFLIYQILTAIAHCHDLGVVHRDVKASNFMFQKTPRPRPKSRKNNKPKKGRLGTPDPDIIKEYSLKVIDFGLSIQLPTTVNNKVPRSGCSKRSGSDSTVSTQDSEEELEEGPPPSPSAAANTMGLMKSQVGTPYYVAPELLTKKPYNNKCDVWGVGVVAYVTLSGTIPFRGKDDRATLKLLADPTLEVPYDKRRWGPVSANAKSFVQSLLQRDPKLRPSARQALQHPWIMEHCGGLMNTSSSSISEEGEEEPNPANQEPHKKHKKKGSKNFLKQLFTSPSKKQSSCKVVQ